MRKPNRAKSASYFSVFMAMLAVFGLVVAVSTSVSFAQQADVTADATQSKASSAVSNVVSSEVSATDFAVSETGLYVIQLADQPLATYEGSVAGLAATSPRVAGTTSLDVNAPASVAYLDYLKTQQSAFLNNAEATLNRAIDVEFQYLNVLNGVAVKLDHAEAQALAALPTVKAVFPDQLRELQTDAGPQLIEAPAIWDGNFGYDEYRGEGVIIGFLDTGVNYVHPSFAALSAGDGYTHINPYGAGVYVGVCDPTNPDQIEENICNDKLIGAWSFVDGPNSGNSAIDWNNHGSHVGATIAGNLHEAVFTVGTEVFTRTVSGVAPRANVISYMVCDPSCPNVSSVAAVNQAIADGVHVLNYSISGSDDPWNDMVDLAFLDAHAAGMFVSASAGNDGPGPSTVAKTGPWNAAVAASTHGRVIANTLDVTSPTQPAELQGVAALVGEGPAITTAIQENIIWAGDVDAGNFEGCSAFPANAFDGAIALISRGACTFATKVDNADAAGAVAVVVYNHVGGPPTVMGGLATTTIPSVMIANGDAVVLLDYIDNNADPEVRINDNPAVVEDSEWEDVIAGFSSRGPSQWDLLKPDYTAPGVNILAAGWNGPDAYVFLGGTSMSSPHSAGAAALLMGRFSAWSPSEVKSALALTANQNMLHNDGVNPAGFFDMGSGRVDLGMATQTGVVMHETIANYQAANPADGGFPRTLNQPSMVNQLCPEVCEWTRTFRSVLSVAATYTATVDAPAGITVTVDPPVFTLPAGASQTVTVTVDATGQPYGDWHFAQVHLDSGVDEIAPDVIWEQGFEGATFPPADWTVFVQGAAGVEWDRTETVSNSGVASARHFYDTSNDVDNWLVTPTFTVPEDAELHFYERGTFMAWYGYSGVWLSTNSCDPADNDFVELAEYDDSATTWRFISHDLSAYEGQEACVAFRYSGEDTHAWFIDDVSVVVPGDTVPTVASVRLPLAFIPVEAAPALFAPASFSSPPVDAGTVATATLTIQNVGALDLDWELFELGDFPNNQIAAPMDAVIWNQPRAGTSGRINNFSNPDNTGIYQSSAFMAFTDVEIDYIHAEGFFLGGSLADATALNWYIYADNNGVPAGNPEDGLNNHIWSYTAAVGDAGVGIADNDMTLDLTAAGEPAVALSAGTYWLLAYPDVPVFSLGPNILYAWYHSGTGQGRQVGPGGLLDFPTDWVGAPEGRAFRLEGQIDCSAAGDIPWLSASPTSGTIVPGDTEDIALAFDATNLMVGEYTAALCLVTNDPNNELRIIPTTLTVVADPIIEVEPASLADTLDYGMTATHAITISNAGLDTLNWTIDEAASPMLASASQVLFDQTSNTTTSGTIAIYDLDGPATWAVQAADDFHIPATETWTIETVFADGFYQGLVNQATEVNVFFYEDDNGLPGTEIYSAPDLMPSNDDNGALTLELPMPVTLSGGHYWVSVQPKMDYFEDGRWFWFQESVQTFNEFTWRNPGNGYGSGCTDWGYGSNCGFAADRDQTFQLMGTSIDQCGDLQDLPWLSVSPASGMTEPGESSMVNVMLDASGLPNGVYSGNLCISSDDPVTPRAYVPVEMTVENAPNANLRVAHLAPFDMDPGTAVTVTLNGAPLLTDFHFGDSTEYVSVPGGDHDVAIYVGSSMTPAISATVTLMPGEDYSAIAVGGAHGWPVELNLYEDDNTAPAAGFGHVRFGHLAPFTSVMTDTLADIRLADGTVIVDDVPYDTLAGYMPLPAGEYDLQVTSADGSVVYMDLAPFTLSEGDILYAVAVGDGTNQDLGVFAWATDAVGMMLPMKAYGVEFMAQTDALTGMVGTTVTYTVYVTNTGNFTDTFDMSLAGNDWTTMAPASVTLGAGEMAMAYVTVEIPADAADGDNDMVTITATSQGDDSVMASVMLTTTASEVPGPVTYTSYLPIVVRP